MRSWLKTALLVTSVFFVVWAGTIYAWRVSNRLPTSSDLVLHFVVLPLGLLGILWLGSTILKKWKKRAAAAPGNNAAINATASGDAATALASDAERKWTLTILGGTAYTRHGQGADSVLESMQHADQPWQLDPELVDAEGFPIATGRIAELDTLALQKSLIEWQSTQAPGDVEWLPEEIRALCLGANTITELVPLLVDHPWLKQLHPVHGAQQNEAVLPVLQLLALMPHHWSAEKRASGAKWCAHLLTQQGWPSNKIMHSPVAATGSTEPLAQLDRLNVYLHRQSLPCLALMVAIESHIGEATINRWETSQRLLTSRNKTGHIPGEAAAALLVADREQTALLAIESVSSLHRVAQAQRDRSIDETGRTSADVLSAAISDAMVAANAPPEQIGMIVSDIDRRPNRVAEMLSAGQTLFPELDTNDAYLATAQHCGEIGAVATVLGLVLAHQKASTDNMPVLCISNCNSKERSAVVVKPVAETASSQDAFSST